MKLAGFAFSAFATQKVYALQYPLKDRLTHLKEIKSNQYDVIIIGGGATGAGVALECATRGLKSVVLEANDFGSGASSKSTKLVHGGVRYLQQVFELKQKNRREKLQLVIDALRERSAFLDMCSYLTNEFPTLIPCNNIFQLGYYYMGSVLYYWVYKWYSDKSSYQFKGPRIVGKQEIQLNIPIAKNVRYGVIYFDGQFNDSMMVRDVILTTSFRNTNFINYTSLVNLIKENDTITGVQVKDQITGEQYSINGKVVVNATGCFADTVRLIDDPSKKKRIIPVAGSHIVVPQKYGSKSWGYLIPKTVDGRVLYILPFQGNTIIGTTEKQLNDPELDPTVTPEEYIWLVNQYCSQFEINSTDFMKDVKSKWCGVRPLVLEEGSDFDSTKEVSRGHIIEVSKSGLISVMGGKWTIFRQMGEETVDKIYDLFERRGYQFERVKSNTKGCRLLGQNKDYYDRNTFLLEMQNLNSKYQVPEKYAQYYLNTYGGRSVDVVEFINTKPEYKVQLHEKFPYTVGEVIYQIRYEMAQKPQDVLLRRTRMAFVDHDSIYTCYNKVVDIMIEEFNLKGKQAEQFRVENFKYLRSLEF